MYFLLVLPFSIMHRPIENVNPEANYLKFHVWRKTKTRNNNKQTNNSKNTTTTTKTTTTKNPPQNSNNNNNPPPPKKKKKTHKTLKIQPKRWNLQI